MLREFLSSVVKIVTILVDVVESVIDMAIGRDGSCEYFNGNLDNLLIYNRALSAFDVVQIYNTGR